MNRSLLESHLLPAPTQNARCFTTSFFDLLLKRFTNISRQRLTFVSDAVPYSSVPQMYKILYCRSRQNLYGKKVCIYVLKINALLYTSCNLHCIFSYTGCIKNRNPGFEKGLNKKSKEQKHSQLPSYICLKALAF